MEDQEVQEPREGIQLFEPDWKVEIENRGFRGQDIVVPEIGVVYLTGTTALDYTASERGLTVLGNRLVIRNAKELNELGLYDTWPVIKNPSGPRRKLVYVMSLPTGELLEGDIDFTPGEDASSPYWNLQDQGEEFLFFAPADPRFLSSLRFSFRS